MKVIYNNKIAEVLTITPLDDNEKYDITIKLDEKTVSITAFSYEWEQNTLLFVPLSDEVTDTVKLQLLKKFDEWYGNTEQDTAEWALEFQILTRMLIRGYLIINPYYLKMEEVLEELLQILCFPSDAKLS